jgi:23S rRNA U2552 (ribose-2'-O)-methylase RlmE/FtsJ
MQWEVLTPPTHPTAQVEADLKSTQQRLRALKSQIDTLDPAKFRAARNWVNPAEELAAQQPRTWCSRAGGKLWEPLVRGQLLRDQTVLHSVHLCEAPGSWQQATGHYWTRHLGRPVRDWQSHSVTLPPEHQRGLLWKTPAAGVVHANLITDALPPQCHFAQLVTGDGGFDVKDFNNQETEMLPLVSAECVKGRDLLTPGGTLIVKLFDMFEATTRRMLAEEVVPYFESTWILKPYASRVGNSERLVMGLKRLQPQGRPACPPLMTRLGEIALSQADVQERALTRIVQLAREDTVAPPTRTSAFHREYARNVAQCLKLQT